VSLAQHVDLIEACGARDTQSVVVLNHEHRDFATSTIVPGLLDDAARVAPPAMSIIRT
jgi:hypothetical protein